MNRISTLITEYNSAKNGTIAKDTISDIAKWVTSIVNIFGLNSDAPPDSQFIGWSGINIPDAAKPYVESISQLRDKLRSKARSTQGLTAEATRDLVDSVPEVEDSNAASTGPYQKVLQDFKADAISFSQSSNPSKDILALCDRIRNVDLWDCDVYLEDRENEPALIRPVTRELRAARQEKEERERQKQMAKEKRGTSKIHCSPHVYPTAEYFVNCQQRKTKPRSSRKVVQALKRCSRRTSLAPGMSKAYLPRILGD